MPYVTTNDGVELYYEERGTRGSGPSLVFVPGLTMSTTWFRNQLEGLSDRFHCVTYDPRSQGRSSKVTHGLRTARAAHDLHEVLTALDLDNAIILGWSYGGLIVLSYVDLFSDDRISGMAIIDAGPTEEARRDWEHGMSHEEAVAFGQMMLDDWPAFADMLVGMMFHRLPVSAEGRAEMVAGVAAMPPEACYEVTRDAMSQDFRDVLPNITVPTMLLIGGHGMCDEPSRDLMMARIPSVQLVTFENSGHAPFMEEAEAFNAAVRAFASSLA